MKTCTKCARELPYESFYKKKDAKDGYSPYCKDCDYKANGAKRLALRQRIAFDKAKLKWEYLLTHPCVDCGESDPIVLEFDHVRGFKIQSISYLVSVSSCSWDKVLEEIAKCEVRCSNCHKRVTAVRGGHMKAYFGGLMIDELYGVEIED